MPKIVSLRAAFPAFVILASLSLFLFARSASADDVTLAVATTNLTVTEGNSLTVDLTLANDLGSPIYVDTMGFDQEILSGDISDEFNFAGIVYSYGTCGALQAVNSGSSCTLSVTLPTFSGAGETDFDDQVDQFIFKIGWWSCPTCGPFPNIVSAAPVDTVVQDAVPTPEPSSLLLLGCGLLGLLAMASLRLPIRQLAAKSKPLG